MPSTGWLTDLQDNPDNYLIVTDGELRLDNPNPAYAGVPHSERPAWMDTILRTGQRRDGSYGVGQAIGGTSAAGGADCAMSHAFNGEQGSQYWNGSTTDGTDTSGPVCRALLTGTADPATEGVTTGTSMSYSVYTPPVGPATDSVQASCFGPSWAAWFLPARDNLPPWGVGPYPDPVDYGAPAYATLEWEAPVVDLVRLEVADGDPVVSADYANDWALNGKPAPVWGDEPTWTGPWQYGSVNDDPGTTPPGRPWVNWSYYTGTPTWQEVPDTSGWDGHDWTEDYTYVPEVTPTTADGILIAWPSIGASVGDDWGRFARPAFKFVLQPPRFRFVYESEAAPRRIYPSEAVGGGRSRVYPLGRAQVRSNRFGGTYL